MFKNGRLLFIQRQNGGDKSLLRQGVGLGQFKIGLRGNECKQNLSDRAAPGAFDKVRQCKEIGAEYGPFVQHAGDFFHQGLAGKGRTVRSSHHQAGGQQTAERGRHAQAGFNAAFQIGGNEVIKGAVQRNVKNNLAEHKLRMGALEAHFRHDHLQVGPGVFFPVWIAQKRGGVIGG